MDAEGHVLKIAKRFQGWATAVTISNLSREDQPLIYSNDAFHSLTGYQANEIEGKNCRFLQGDETDQSVVDRLRADLDTFRSAHHCILNYRQDGSPFHNMLMLEPMTHPSGERFVIGCQYEINRFKRQDDLAHHVGLVTGIAEQMNDDLRTSIVGSNIAIKESLELRTYAINNMIQAYVRATALSNAEFST